MPRQGFRFINLTFKHQSMMGSSEKFCLKWNDFQDNVTKSFSKFRQESGLFDVTLVGSDQKQLSAHRLVLSACSDFFMTIFHSNTQPMDNDYQQFEEIHEEIVEPLESEAKAVSSKTVERSLRAYNETFEASNSEVEKKFLELIVKENKLYRCTVCEKTQTDKTKMRLHLETHLTGLSYDCPICGKNFRSRNAFNTHISREHNKV